LLDIIQSKEARQNFLEFIYDHHAELEKWQQYYQERFRVRIIEWLRNNQFDFVFEEDLEMTKSIVEKLKLNTLTAKAPKDVLSARKLLFAKAKTYYSSEALNPRPKRGRPPKQVAKVETEPQFSQDIYLTVPKAVKPFLFVPDYQGSSSIFTFSDKFASEADLIAHKRQQLQGIASIEVQSITQKLATLRTLSSHWLASDKEPELREEAAAETFSDRDNEDIGSRKKLRAQAGVREKTTVAKESVIPAKVKSVAKKSKGGSGQSALPKTKARLRPLVKKAVIKAAPKEKSASRKVTTPLRHLRRSKKK
jgi:hypothetical protein